MLKAMVRRSLLSVLILFLVAVFVFLATEVLPGDALDVYLSEDDVSVMTLEDIEEMRRDLGLDVPAPRRFLSWFSGAIVGDFGVTIVDKIPIGDIIFHPLLNSLQLGSVITLITIPIAFAIGATAGYYRGRRLDAVISTTTIIGYSIPDFVIGTVLIIIFAVWIPLFPAVITAFNNTHPLELLAVSLLPAITVIIGHVAHLSRLLRAGFIETMNSDFVERARLSGVPERNIVLRHILPASVIPTLNAMALYMAGVLSGLIVVEKVFGYPGLGIELIEAVDTREVAVVQAIAFLGAMLVIVMNLLADFAIIALDPRVRSHVSER
ncbi:MAG: ABC transporter permease [Alphaproteobacteria bacterium]|nr:ABC transporter permease [Alphaproteobacteria bacterium]